MFYFHGQLVLVELLFPPYVRKRLKESSFYLALEAACVAQIQPNVASTAALAGDRRRRQFVFFGGEQRQTAASCNSSGSFTSIAVT